MLRSSIKSTRDLVGPSTFVRYKSKTKINVQLHKDVPGLGLRGEIVRVLPGRMRNQLHPHNGASYVLEGKPLRLPVVTRQQAALEEEKRRAALLASQTPEVEVVVDETVDYSELGFLQFPKGSSEASEPIQASENEDSDLYSLHNALQSLPNMLSVRNDILETGFLKEHYSAKEFANYISDLIGFPLTEEFVQFQVTVAPRKTVSSGIIDHTGTYSVRFVIPGSSPVERKISITGPNGESQRRPFGTPLPGESELTSEQPTKQATESDKSSESETSKSQSFPWENDFISELERRVRK